MKSLFTQISNEERSTILEMHKSKKVISEQPLPPANGGMGVPNLNQQMGQQKEEQKKRFFCVRPDEFTIKGKVANSFIYQDKSGDNVFYDDGIVRLYGFGSVGSSDSSERLNMIKKGTWKCGSNGNIEVSWENDPKAIGYYPVPSQRQKKGLNSSQCAQSIKDIHSGKFLFKGCKSPAVKEVQSKLGMTKTTDFFGDITRNKVIEFQKVNKINPDGIVGQDTLSFLIPNVAGQMS